MRKWGIVISVFYAIIVVAILVPAIIPLAVGTPPWSKDFGGMLASAYGEWFTWLPVAVVLAGQVMLLFLSVDTSFKKLRPRAHVAVTVVVASMLLGLLAFAAMCCIGCAIRGDKFGSGYLDNGWGIFGLCAALWLLWGVVFFLYVRDSTQPVTRAVSWLLKGSVLELLIAVPCHVIVRRRNDCSAPLATGFGIVTGIAVMLLSFGPSILFLYKKRLGEYGAGKPI